MAYFGGIFFANMGGGGGQNYFHPPFSVSYVLCFFPSSLWLALCACTAELLRCPSLRVGLVLLPSHLLLRWLMLQHNLRKSIGLAIVVVTVHWLRVDDMERRMDTQEAMCRAQDIRLQYLEACTKVVLRGFSAWPTSSGIRTMSLNWPSRHLSQFFVWAEREGPCWNHPCCGRSRDTSVREQRGGSSLHLSYGRPTWYCPRRRSPSSDMGRRSHLLFVSFGWQIFARDPSMFFWSRSPDKSAKGLAKARAKKAREPARANLSHRRRSVQAPLLILRVRLWILSCCVLVGFACQFYLGSVRCSVAIFMCMSHGPCLAFLSDSSIRPTLRFVKALEWRGVTVF